MDMSIRQLRAFLAVADARSFSAAATTMHTAQSNVSRVIAELEQATGCTLFLRTTRSVSLTDEGVELESSARSILATHEREMARFTEILAGSAGVAKVAALPSVSFAVLPSYYERMRSEHPQIRIELREGAADDIIGMLENDEVHAAIGFDPGENPHIGSERYISDDFVAIVSERSALAACPTLTWRELTDETFVALSSQTSVRQLTDAAFRRQGVHPHSVIHVPNTAAVAGLVAKDIGVSALPGLALGLFDYPGLVRIPLRAPTVTRELHLLYRRDLSFTRVGAHALSMFRAIHEDRVALPFGAEWAASPPGSLTP